MLLNNKIVCPLCNGSCKLLNSFNTAFLTEELEKYFRSASVNLDILNYELYRCKVCSLEFANPLVPGSNNYYSWLSQQKGYYPLNRWEFPIAKSIVGKHAEKRHIEVVEIGSGSGVFLQQLNDLRNVTALGIDTTSEAVEACNRNGVNAYCGTLEDFCTIHPNQKFDIACSFHCLEHVPDPLGFMQNINKVLRGQRIIIISTPYSPMTFERKWFDPMNHPPHHMTRWNKRSYEKLAEKLGMKVTLQTSPSYSLNQRVKEAIGFLHDGPHANVYAISLKKVLNKIPLSLAKEFIWQKQRDKVANQVAGNAVLAVFYYD